MSRLHVVLAGGGTAGHIEPALALADALRRLAPGTEVTALGTARGLETTLVPARGYPLELIPPVPMPRRPTLDVLKVPFRLAGAVKAAAAVLERTRADVLVGFGGYVALPGYLAARRLGVPIVVHEQNARPGLANRIGARLTTHVAVSTPELVLRHAVHLGVPLRPAVSGLDRAAQRTSARAELGLPADGPVLLVTGGSQGARSVNTAVLAAAPALAQAGVSVLHATGRTHHESVTAALPPGTAGAPYVAVAYLERIERAYAAADLALCRSGAGTVAELAAVGLPAVYVPLPIGNGEQRLNAEPLVAAGGGVLLADAELDAARLLAEVLPLLTDPGALDTMARAAAGFGRPDADVALARMVLDVAEASGRERAAT